MVIGNLLHTRKYNVKLILQDGSNEDILISETDVENGIEIEKLIVSKIKAKHDAFFESQKS